MYTHIHGASLDFRNRVIHQALHDASCHPKEKEKAFRFVRKHRRSLKLLLTVALSLSAPQYKPEAGLPLHYF